MILGKPEHSDLVRDTRQGAAISNYFHTSHTYHQGITNDEVARLVEVRLQKERKIREKEWKRREDEWRRQEDDFRALHVWNWKMRQKFQINTNPSSYLPPYYTPQSGYGSCSILRIYQRFQRYSYLIFIYTHTYTHTYTPTYLYAYLSCLVVSGWLYSSWFGNLIWKSCCGARKSFQHQWWSIYSHRINWIW